MRKENNLIGIAIIFMTICSILAGCTKDSPVVNLTRQGGDLIVKGNYTSALEKLTEAINLDPNFPYSYYFRAIIYINNGDSEKAFADYHKAKSLYTREAQAQIGSEYLTRNGFDKPINNLGEALYSK